MLLLRTRDHYIGIYLYAIVFSAMYATWWKSADANDFDRLGLRAPLTIPVT
jgi:hypothetical protein